MHTSRSHIPISPIRARSRKKWFWLLFLAAIGLGLSYIYLNIQLMMVKARLSDALTHKVIDTTQYARLTQTAVKQRVSSVLASEKIDEQQVKLSIAILPKDTYKALQDYTQQPSLRGYKSAGRERPTATAGCSTTDALPPGTTIQDIAGKGTGKGSMTNRLKGIVAKDGKAIVSGETPRTSTPDNSVILAVDVLINYKFWFFTRKLWFHQRCFFYAKRRPYEESKLSKDFLQE